MTPAALTTARRWSALCLLAALLCGCANETQGPSEPVPALRTDLSAEADAELLQAARELLPTDAIDLATSAFRDDALVTLERRSPARSIDGPAMENGRRRDPPLRLRLETTGSDCRLAAPDLGRSRLLTIVRCRAASAP